jgi:RNA polymerase sigma-70 factor (ECF subfamily)
MKNVNPAMTTTMPLRRPIAHAPSFTEVAEQHLDDVYRYLLVFTRDPTLAEDLAGETFERAFRTWRQFDPRRASARTWLCLIARSTALDHFRSEKRRVRREESVAEARREVDAPEVGLSPELERALASLSAADREVIALRIVLDLDARAAAQLLGVNESACTTRLNRALKRLEEGMTSDDE